MADKLIFGLNHRFSKEVKDVAGSWLFESGDVLKDGKQIGTFTSTTRSINEAESHKATLTMTLFLEGTGQGENITLSGTHDIKREYQFGGVSALSPGEYEGIIDNYNCHTTFSYRGKSKELVFKIETY